MANEAKFDALLAAWVDESEEVEEAVDNAEAEDAEEGVETEEAEETETEEVTEESAEEEDDKSDSDAKAETKTETKAETKSDAEDTAKGASDRESKIRNAMQADVDEYNRLYPDDKIEKIDDIPDALAFAKMRRGGMTVEEAARYVRASMKRDKSNGKEHIRAASAQRASSSGIEGMTNEEYAAARQIFGDMPKKELESLFKRTRSK